MRAVRLGLLLVVLSSSLASADDHVVLVDEDVNFSRFRTFMLRNVSITSKHPALNSPLVGNVLRAATNTALVERGLTRLANQAALIVDCTVRGADFGIDRMGRPVEQLGRGRAGREPPPSNRRGFTEGTLVIDVIRADTKALIWRGVYHDTDPDPAKIAEALPKHAARLLSQFPRQRKP